MNLINSAVNISYRVMLPVFIILVLALLMSKWLKFDLRLLSRLIIYVFTPFLVLESLTNANLSGQTVWLIVLMALISSIILLVSGWLVSKSMRLSQKTESAFMLSTLISNAGFLGFPVVEFGFGKESLQYAVLFFAVVNIFTNSIGVFLASRGALSISKSIKNVFTVPLVYVTVLSLTLNYYQIQLPLPVQRVSALLGQATVPCALILMGLQISQMSLKGKGFSIIAATVFKLIWAPVVAIITANLLNMPDLVKQVTVTQISMPTALFASVFATEYGSDVDFATAVTLMTTLGSIITLSILIALLA